MLEANQLHCDEPRQAGPSILSQFGWGLLMLFVPAATVIVTTLVCQFLDESWGWDERYLSLFSGIPSAIVAWIMSAIYWQHRHYVTAVLGAILWTLLGVLAIWVMMAFWDG